jgi:hypothetical protein
MDTIYTDALRAEFWREFESMVRVHFMPFVGNVKAVWQWDKAPDTQSVEHLGTKLSVTLAECSRARMRVVVVPVIPWKSDAKEYAVEWEPDDGEPETYEWDPGEGRRISTTFPCVLKVWVVYVALSHMLSKKFSLRVSTRDTHMHLVAGRGWGPGWMKLRLYAVVSKKASTFLEVVYYERVRLSMSAEPQVLPTPLLMEDTRALWRFIEAELDRPWSSWPWSVGGLSLDTGPLQMLEEEDGGTVRGVPKKKI